MAMINNTMVDQISYDQSAAVIENSVNFGKNFPVGYRFRPHDDELVNYLRMKANNITLPINIIREIQLYKDDPEVITAISKPEEDVWYFFTKRERKYPNGVRPARSAGDGYWKPTGTDKCIREREGGKVIGYKKTLDYYWGKHPAGDKTGWKMHEYRINHKSSPPPPATSSRNPNSNQMDDIVLCKIYKKKHSKKNDENGGDANTEEHGEGDNDATTTMHDDLNLDQTYSIPQVYPLSYWFPNSPCNYTQTVENQVSVPSDMPNLPITLDHLTTSTEANQVMNEQANVQNHVPKVQTTSSDLPPFPESIDFSYDEFAYLHYHLDVSDLDTSNSYKDNSKDDENEVDM